MAVHLLKAALASTERNTISNYVDVTIDRKDKRPAHKAMSHTAKEGIHVASDECISPSSSPDTKKEGQKKKQPMVAGGGQSTKKAKVEPTFTAASGTDGPVQCIFVEEECIPLWPQYVHKPTLSKFIRVGPTESWLLLLISAMRKSALQGHAELKRMEKKQKTKSNGVGQICM